MHDKCDISAETTSHDEMEKNLDEVGKKQTIHLFI